MNLHDLKKNLTSMSDAELQAQLMEIRQSRRTSKKAATPKKEAQKKDTSQLFAALNSLTPEERAQLLQQLKGELT